MLEGEYNVYGIQAKGILRPAKLPETLEEMITEYIVEMKTIQPEGPYTIVGYCYGNWIAYKMVEMLEDQDVSVDRMIQIDENDYLPDKARELCAKRAQLTRPYRGIRKYVRKFITRRYSNPMDYYPTLEEYRKANPPVEGPINNERTVRENVDYLCTKGYTLRRLVYVDTYVIKAEENNLQRYTKEDWEKQVYGKVWFTEIPGGHETIFNPPYVEELTNQIRIALED
jgi:thioesterase domain-containing protein